MTLTRARPARSTSACSSARPRADGLHPLVSRRPAGLARRRADAASPARRRGRGRLPRRRGPEPRRAARSRAFRAAHRLGRAAAAADDRQADPGRRRHGRRLGRRRRRAAARRRSAAGAADRRAELAAAPRRRRPRLLRPGRALMTGAGEHVEPLPDPDAARLLVLPLDAALSHARGLPRVRRLAPPRDAARARASCDAGCARASRRRSVNDLEAAARRLCPAIDARARRRCARPARRTRWSPAPARPCSACSAAPTARRAREPPPATPRALRRRRRAGAELAAVPPLKWTWLARRAVALAGWLIARRHKHGRAGSRSPAGRRRRRRAADRLRRHPPAQPREADRGRRPGARQVDLPARRRARVPRDRRVPRASSRRARPRCSSAALVAGQGQISLCVLIAIVWACAVAGDLTSYTLGRRLGRGWLLRHGARLKITEERLDQVEGFFERRGGDHDPGRALHRLRAPARAVHRRRVEDAAAPLPALRRARRRACGRSRSACSATSSGARSTSSRPTSRAGCSRSARSSCDRPGDLARPSAPPPRRARSALADERGQAASASSGSPGRGTRRSAGPRSTFASPTRRRTLGLELTTLLALAAVGTLPVLRPRRR